jgi:hypothetical protein
MNHTSEEVKMLRTKATREQLTHLVFVNPAKRAAAKIQNLR